MSFRSSRPEMFCEKGVLKNSQNSQGNTCARLFFNKVAGLKACNFIKKRLQHGCFLVKFAKLLRAPILKNMCQRLVLLSELNGEVYQISWSQSFTGALLLNPPQNNIYLFIHLCVYLFIYLSIYLFIYFTLFKYNNYAAFQNKFISTSKTKTKKTNRVLQLKNLAYTASVTGIIARFDSGFEVAYWF